MAKDIFFWLGFAHPGELLGGLGARAHSNFNISIHLTTGSLPLARPRLLSHQWLKLVQACPLDKHLMKVIHTYITAARLCSSGMNRLSSKGKTPKFDPLAFKNYLSDQNQNYHNWLRRQVLQVCQIGWRLPFPSSPHVGVKYKHFFCMYVCIYVCRYVCITFLKCLSSGHAWTNLNHWWLKRRGLASGTDSVVR